MNKDDGHMDGFQEVGRGQIMKGFKILIRSLDFILSIMVSYSRRLHVFKKSA